MGVGLVVACLQAREADNAGRRSAWRKHLGIQRPGNVALAGRRTMGGPDCIQLFMRCTPHASACLCIPASTNSKVHIQRTQNTKMALTMREFLPGNLKL